jgi:hypothetical protein
MKLPADVILRTYHRDGFRDREVEISADRLARLAAAGRIPSEQHYVLREHAKLLVIVLNSVMEELSEQLTRTQLRRALVDLLKLARSGTLPPVPNNLRAEIELITVKYRDSLPIGRAGPPITSPEQLASMLRSGEAARAEAQAAFANAQALAALIKQLLDYMRARDLADPEHPDRMTREIFKAKGAYRPEVDILLRWIGGFWRKTLQRAPTISDELRDFSIETFKLCGVKIAGLSMERRLQLMVEGRCSP